MNVKETRSRNLLSVLFSITLFSMAGTVNATVIYGDRTSFEANISSSITDDYSHPNYSFIQNDATMSAVLGETDYMTTGHDNLNIINNDNYCAGCNGSFQLSFTSTSLGTNDGIFGVGLDIRDNTAYGAFITFGDHSTQSYLLGTGFFGITTDLLIQSIHFGVGDGSIATTSGVNGIFQIDNLTIASSGVPVPLPATVALMSLGLVGVVAFRRKRVKITLLNMKLSDNKRGSHFLN